MTKQGSLGIFETSKIQGLRWVSRIVNKEKCIIIGGTNGTCKNPKKLRQLEPTKQETIRGSQEMATIREQGKDPSTRWKYNILR